MKKLTIIILFVLSCAGIWASQSGTQEEKQIVSPTQNVLSVADGKSPEQSLVRSTRPRRLLIPELDINAAVEYVGLDEKGNMDVPKNDMHVAWFEPGYLLGEQGNTVLAGHFDKKSGDPAVFFNLQRLQPGDRVTVVGENKEEYEYYVTRVEKYPYTSFPLEEIFGPYHKNRLNLITCEGSYNNTTQNYSHRLVVYAEEK